MSITNNFTSFWKKRHKFFKYQMNFKIFIKYVKMRFGILIKYLKMTFKKFIG